MSENETVIAREETKSLDKKEIEDEEREKMLNEENKNLEETLDKAAGDMAEIIRPSSEPCEDGREVKPKFIPIGGIKMPGFFTRSKSKEKCKDGEDGAQGELLEKPPVDDALPPKEAGQEKEVPENSFKSRLASIKITNPFAKKPKSPAPVPEDGVKEAEVSNTEAAPPKKGLLNAIRLPLAGLLPRRLRPVDTEAGLDSAKTAELASMETLDDNKDVESKDIQEDGMENVKLDIEDKTDSANAADKEKLNWRERVRQQKCIIDDWAIAGGIAVFLLLLIIIIAVTASGGPPSSAPIKDGRYVDAVTSCGLVEGVLEDGAYAFRGIPYAVPPLGENRWRAAMPLDNLGSCWNGTLQTHNATPPCMQIYANGTQDGIEDCLTLDVITPHVRYDTPLPVIVLIGSNTLTGGTPGKLRPSTQYARSKDVLFVRPNFRIGVFGFLALDALSDTAYPHISGNYGLSDIIAALKWVKLNIRNFGGDPSAVTLFGHRAGATLVSALVGYKKPRENLFARAWVSSGSALYPKKPLDDNEKSNESYMELVKCKDAQCLRDADATTLMQSVPDTWRGDDPDLPSASEEPDKRHEWLVLDGAILGKNLVEELPESNISLVIGTTAHESASNKLFQRHSNWTSELVWKHVNDSKIGQLGLTDEAIQRYNATYQGLAAMISDIRTVCPLLALARHRPSIRFYVVTQPHGENDLAGVDCDISAILGRYEPRNPEQRRYIAAMQQLFYQYVWLGEVPPMHAKNKAVLLVGQDVMLAQEYENCDFWTSNGLVSKFARQD